MEEMDLHTIQKDIEENLKVGLLDILILKLISEGDTYGYDIRNKLRDLSNGAITISDGSLYGPLYRLEKKNLISSYRKIVGEKRFRIYYHIEEKGLKHLKIAMNEYIKFYDAANSILGLKKQA